MSMSMVGFSPRVSVLRNAKNPVWLLAAIFALCFVCLPLFSQSTQGTIQGAVFDQSGGAVLGATVSVIDVARGVTRTLTTDSAGEYVAANLTLGTYTVRAESKGFKIEERSGVLVQVGENIRVDLVLQPGEQNQTVTITEDVPAVDTTDATLGGAVANQAINDLPLNGRNFARLLELRPGTVAAVGTGSGTTQTNGRRNSSDNLRVDGISEINDSQGATILNLVYSGGDSSSSVPIDAIQEFSEQENPKAEYGFRDGAVINLAIKSGTNGLHGTAYAFGRDASATDAANFFTHLVTPATLEQFGGSAGGPIVKDKLFWFANYEGLRVVVGNSTLDTLPVDVAGTGVTSSMVDACNALNPTHLANGAPGNPINALSAQLAGLNTATCTVTAPSPTNENLWPYVGTAVATNNYLPNDVNTTPLNNGIFKGDYDISAHHHLNAMAFISKSQGVSASTGSTGSVIAVLPQWGTFANNDAEQYSGHWIWTPNSTWVNDFTLGYVFLYNYRVTGDANLLPSNPWPNGYGMNTGVTNPLFGGLPALTFTSLSQLGGGGTRTGARGPQGDVDLIESVSYLHGKHTFKFGFEFMDILAEGDTYPNSYGSVKFTTLENFLTGTTNGGSIEYGNPAQYPRAHWFGVFAQDDWRVTPKVTVNLGVRYDYVQPPVERTNYLGNFNPNAAATTVPAIQQFGPGAPLPSEYNAGPGLVSPRGGLAWDIFGNGKTVLRAGGSMLQDATELGPLIPITPFGANFPSIGVNNSGTAPNANTPVTASFVAGQLCANNIPCIDWNTTANLALTNNTIFPSSTSQGGNGSPLYTGPSCNVPGVANGQCQTGAVDPNFKHAYAIEWNLDIQRAITSKLSLDVAYVGNHGSQEEQIVDLNQPVIGAGWTASAIATCLGTASASANYNNCKPSAAAEVGSITCPTCAYSSIFPYLSNIDEATNGDFSNYNGLQVTFQGRNYHGLSFISAYTFSHALSISDGNSVNTQNTLPTDKNNLRLDYGNGATDLRNRFTFSPTYQIPGLKSPGEMLEGWSVNAIVTLQSGFFWNPSDTTTFDWLGTGEKGNSGIGNGVTQFWNYSGPRSAFTVNNANPIPCFGAASGCTSFASLATAPPAGLALTPVPGTGAGTPVVVPTECYNAAQAPYAGNAQLQQLALAALLNTNSACYAQNGGVLTPPAFGTVGNASKGIFLGPNYMNVDFSVGKLWKFRERYTAQFRAEFFNLFNHADFAAPGGNPTQGFGKFGTSTSTPDSTNSVLGSGGPRHIQFGLKLTF